jgi:cell division protein ZapE
MTGDLTPPARFAEASFDTYVPQNASQAAALKDARALTEGIRHQHHRPFWRRWLNIDHPEAIRGGLYLVGPVGTGKTHLLVSIYRALHPQVPCAFLHSSRLFRATVHPQAYARQLANNYRVLLIDEVELDDPANEARLIQVLKTLHQLGVTVASHPSSTRAGRDRAAPARPGRRRSGYRR